METGNPAPTSSASKYNQNKTIITIRYTAAAFPHVTHCSNSNLRVSNKFSLTLSQVKGSGGFLLRKNLMNEDPKEDPLK